MTVNYDDIKDDFQELRSFFKNDLHILIQSSVGGNYATVLVATTACEVLGPLRFENNGEREFFSKYLLPDTWHAVAPSLYDALRNGLAHSYATKTILHINGANLELSISWSEKPHLKFDCQHSILYINVRELAQRVNEALATYETELKTQPQLCALYAKRRQKKRTINIHTSSEREAWKALLSSKAIET
jgi:hypothetical protein